MNFHCLNCHKIEFINSLSIQLLQNFFANVTPKYSIHLLCEDCGKRVLGGYRDIHGIGI